MSQIMLLDKILSDLEAFYKRGNIDGFLFVATKGNDVMSMTRSRHGAVTLLGATRIAENELIESINNAHEPTTH